MSIAFEYLQFRGSVYRTRSQIFYEYFWRLNSPQQPMAKYNILKENNIELSKIDENGYKTFQEPSMVLRNKAGEPRTQIIMNFLASVELSTICGLFLTITRKKYKNVYYGYDSSAFCLIRTLEELVIDKEYHVYGRVMKRKFYFVDCIAVKEIDYREVCSMIL